MGQISASKTILWCAFAVLATTSLVRNDVFLGRTNVINWDGYGYYAYLPAIFVYGDVTDYAFAEAHFANYEISDNIYQLMDTPEGGRFPIYNLGLAVVWTPGFLLAHGFCQLTGTFPADGMSYPYQLSVVLTSLLVFWLGLLFLRRFLLRFYTDRTVAFTLCGLTLGTNLFYYLVEGPDMTHAYLFAGYAIFLDRFVAAGDREEAGQNTGKIWLICGIVAGLMCLTRSSEIVIFALPALYGLRDRITFRRNFWRALRLLGIAAIIFSLQLVYYQLATGAWFRDGYAGLGFDWLSPHLYEGLIGYRRGWLVYTPLMVFALLGIAWLPTRWRWAVAGFTVANLYLLFSWHIWWYGDTFGSRPVVQSYAVLSLPLAAFLSWILGEPTNFVAGADPGRAEGRQSAGAMSGMKRAKWRTWLVTAALAGFIFLNLFQHWQYNQRILPLDFVNKTYYWHVFGKTTLNKKDRVYLDTNEKMPPAKRDTLTLLVTDSLITIAPKTRREYTNLVEYQLQPTDIGNDNWLDTELTFAYFGDTYDKWRFPGIVTEIRRGEEIIKWVQVKIPPILENPAADTLHFRLSLPEAQAGDLIKQYVWNLSQDSMTISRTHIDLLQN